MALLAAIGAAAMIVAVVGGRNALRAAAAPPTVNVTLRATPDEARFSIDDGPAVTNPYVAELPRDEKMHRIRTFAPGYDDKDQQLPFASDVSLRVSLAKHPAR
jgi:hypothetical protein